jgi:hypothetical protein
MSMDRWKESTGQYSPSNSKKCNMQAMEEAVKEHFSWSEP